MFAVTIHFPTQTLKFSKAMPSTDILNLEVLMVSHGYKKSLSKISIDHTNKIATLQYDIWFDKE